MRRGKFGLVPSLKIDLDDTCAWYKMHRLVDKGNLEIELTRVNHSDTISHKAGYSNFMLPNSY